MKSFLKATLFAAAGVALASSAPAQWVINEVETETTGTNIQFVELYNPTPNASVAGLTVINIRSSQARAISSIDLTGNAVGNFYLIGNSLYNTSAAGISQPAPNAVLGLDFRGQFHQTLLVNTADLPGGFTAGGAGYVFNGTEFSNGTQIIDSVQNTSGDDPILFAAQNTLVYDTSRAFTPPELGAAPYAMGRFPDGANSWVANYALGLASTISINSTPGVSNTFNEVEDWMAF